MTETTKTTTAGEIADSIIDNIPDAMKAPAPTGEEFKLSNEPAPAAPGASVQVDTLKRPFDPAKFIQRDGKPATNGKGHFIPKSPGRWGGKAKPPVVKPVETSPGAEPPPARSVVAPDEPAPVAPAGPGPWDRFDYLADVYAKGGYSALDAIFQGQGEWAPENQEEHEGIRQSVAAYMRIKNVEDLPPGWALAFALGTYAAKRLQKPNTATRVRLYFGWLRARVSAFWTGRRIVSASPGAPGVANP